MIWRLVGGLKGKPSTHLVVFVCGGGSTHHSACVETKGQLVGVRPFPSWVLGFTLRSSDLAAGPFSSEPSHQPEPRVLDHELAQKRTEPPQVSDHAASI